MSTVTQPRTGVPIGVATVSGKPLEIELHPEYLRFFTSLVQRIGGVASMSNAELAQLVSEPIKQDARTDDAIRAIDELRNELASLRASCDQLRGLLDEQASAIMGLRPTDDLRARVETIEGRLQ
jgi:hypothetical protein